MVPIWETIFWLSLGILLYIYAGYPFILLMLTAIAKRTKLSGEPHIIIYEPVTLLVAAYNEEKIIEEKIKNCLSLDYPKEKIKIIFVTDGSDDATLDIIKKYPSVNHLHNNDRRGKLAAINRAMEFVDTPFVIFSDANALLNKKSIALIMQHYSDTKVGGVAGEKKVVASGSDDTVGKGEGLYWKYESAIKKLDSKIHSVVGAAGELFSVRTALYSHLPEKIILDDFVQSLSVCMKGYVVRYEPGAFAKEKGSLSVKDEMERKVRITAGGFQAMVFLRKLFNVFHNPLLSFQYISHRVLRWTLAPVALVTLFLASVLVWYMGGPPFYSVSALLQAIFYALAMIGWLIAAGNRHPGPFYLPFYFSFMHFCVFGGLTRYLRGKQRAAWKKAVR